PSARIVARIAEVGVPGIELTPCVLPVSFACAATEVERLLINGQFDLALMLGVAGNESELRVETFARNLDSARIVDCDGFQPHGCIAKDGPEVYKTSVDTELIIEGLLEGGYAARESVSAGGYVCNRAYYTALQAINSNALSTRCLFVH